MKRIDLNVDDLMQLYQSGESAPKIAKRFGVSANVIRRRLQEIGTTLTGNRSIYDEDAAIQAFLDGGSVKGVAEQFGVQRRTITALLRKHGITPRNRRDAMLLRMAQATPEERQRLTEAAHAACRGRRVPEECQIRIAEGRERTKAHASFEALALAEILADRGFPVTLEKAFGPYNIDIALDERSIAVEIQGGNWHGFGRHGARLGKRREYILSRGWHLVEVWRLQGDASVTMQAMADNLITELEALSLDPSGRGEHRMIRCNGQALPASKSYGYDVAPVHGAERRCEESGRYLRLA
jgi:transposase